MRDAVARCGVLLVLLAVTTACGSGPVATPTAPTPASGTPPPGFPAVTGAARTYVHAEAQGGLLVSRYVLHDDGTFALQYTSGGYPSGEYRGTYSEAGGLVTFEWEGRSAAGPWGATAVLTEETLAVRYNLVMQMTDFEDGVYLRVP